MTAGDAPDFGRLQRRRRVGLIWAAGALVLCIYASLPEGDDAEVTDAIPIAGPADDPPQLAIVDVVPSAPSAGSAIVIRFSQAGPTLSAADANAAPEPAEAPKVWIGKRELPLLAQRAGALVAQLPSDLKRGRIKLRISLANERSKSFELRIKAVNWRKPFRDLCGGLALLVLGVRSLSRGARGALGLASARRIATLARSPLAAVSFGAATGVLVQSTTGVAGLLAGFVSSRVVSEVAAATAFVGAQVAAAAAPLLLANVVEPRIGLLAIALGTLALGLAPDRRGRALARLLLGAGLVSFGVQVLRPGFEPFMSEPAVLGLVARLSSDGPEALLVAAAGTLLVALFQGPAPLLFLSLIIAELTGHFDLHTTLVLLSGSGLGAGLVALLTIPGTNCRMLGQLNLLAGATSTLISLATVGVFSPLAQRLLTLPRHWLYHGKHALPAISWPIAVTFLLSQLLAAGFVLAILPLLARLLERQRMAKVPAQQRLADTHAIRFGLVEALAAQQRALPDMLELAADGVRSAGARAEDQLNAADRALATALDEPLRSLPPERAAGGLSRAALACSQLQRALKDVLRRAEHLTETRIAWSESGVAARGPVDSSGLREIHGLLDSGIASLVASLRARTQPEPDETCTREIQINATEAQVRKRLLAEPRSVSSNAGLMELIAAYETAGNQLYRVADALADCEELENPRSTAVSQRLEPSGGTIA